MTEDIPGVEVVKVHGDDVQFVGLLPLSSPSIPELEVLTLLTI